MKFVLVLIALVGMSHAAPQPNGLLEDFKDIASLLPVDKLGALFQKYLNSDSEFQQVIVYLKGPGWAGIVEDVRTMPEYQEFKAYLIAEGIDVDAFIQWVHDLVGGANPNPKAARGMREFYDELIEILPGEEIAAMVADKLENSASFQELYKTMASEKGKTLFEKICALDEVHRIADILRSWDVRIDLTIDMINEFFGWN